MRTKQPSRNHFAGAPWGRLSAVTAALAAAGLLTTPAQAQLQTAGAVLVDVNATGLSAGPLTSLPNGGTMGGFFEARGGGANNPVVAAVNANGTRGIRLDGSDFLQHVVAVGGATLPAAAGLVGPNPTSSVEVWVLNPWPAGEETVVSWGKRGGPDGSNKSMNYGFDSRWGAIGHWGGADIGWDPCCNDGNYPPGVPTPGVWHHLVYTFDGTTTRVYSDGVLKNSEAFGLNTAANTPITIGAQLEGDGVTVTGDLRGTLTIGRLRIHEEALSEAAVLNNYNVERAEFNSGTGAALAFGPIHRYSFDNAAGAAAAGAVITDSVGGAHGTVQGANANFTGERVVLPGGGSATEGYVDLPNGMISRSSLDNGGSGQVTVEGWVKINGTRNWARIFDFGSTEGGEIPAAGGGGQGLDYVFLSASEGGNANVHVGALRNVDPPTGSDVGSGYRTPHYQTDFHFAMTWDEGSGQIRFYENGSQTTSLSVNTGTDRMSAIKDVNVWLGRSNWAGDENMQGEYDEVRIHDRLLSADEVRGSYVAGPAVVAPAQPITLVRQPQAQTVQAGQDVTFTVAAQGVRPHTFQWYRGSDPIVGATGFSYTLAGAAMADSGSEFHVVAGNAVGGTPQSATSASAVLTVVQDVVAPALVSAAAPAGNPTQFDLVYSEPVDAADAVNLANYAISGGVTLTSATLQADNRTVRFASSALDTPGVKILTVNSVRDRAFVPNTIAANSQIAVIYAQGSIRRHRFDTGGGVLVADLTSSPLFPNNPTEITFPTEFQTPPDVADNYGVQLLGLVTAPVTGNYRFFISADDQGVLYLSTDESPANKVQIAAEPIWNGQRDWNGTARRNAANPENRSALIPLQAGQRYYIEAMMKEGGGGDNLAVTWQKPGDPVPVNGSAALPGQFLSPYNVPAAVGAGQPADQTVNEGTRVTLSVDISGSPNLSIQWYRNGAPITGATSRSLTTAPLLHPEDNGAAYHVVVENSLGSATSRTALITVLEDTTAPALVAAHGSATFLTVTVAFDGVMQPAEVEDSFSYGIGDGANPDLTILAAVRNNDERSVTLTLDGATPLLPGALYTVTVSGVKDFAGNEIAPGSTIQFRSFVDTGCGGVLFEAFFGIPGNAATDLSSHAKFPNSPDFRATIQGFDSRLAFPDDSHEGYGGRLRGLFIPPSSGQWILYLRSDDGSQLFFNPAGPDPAGKLLVQQELGCCGAFEGHATQPFALTGGQPYYIESLYKEGGGGDYVQVAARLAGSGDALAPIPGSQLGQLAEPGSAGTVTITAPPADTTVAEATPATFTVGVANTYGLPVCYQWSRDGMDLPGATGPSYSFLPVLADSGASFTVRVSIVGDTATSAAAVLTVTADTTRPVLLGAAGRPSLNQIVLSFNELIDPFSAEDNFNYSVDGGLSLVGNPALNADGRSVTLTTTPQTPDTVYTVTVNSVKDRSEAGNEVAPGSTASFRSFVLSCGFLLFEAYFNNPGAAISGLTGDPNFPNNPSETLYMTAFDTRTVYPSDVHENYGGRISGVFVPPSSGNWIFYLRSDDASQLFLNPAGTDPNGKVLLTEETGCCGAFAGHASAPQALVAGQPYYIEGLYKEGGGGDYMQVAAKLDTDPANPNSLSPISAAHLGIFANPVGADVTITQQPADQLFVLTPPGSGNVATLQSADFTSNDGGLSVTTPRNFNAPWTYNAGAGSWQVVQDGAEVGFAMTTQLRTPALTVTRSGVVRVAFQHRYSFEGDFWDGGNLRISINGGAFTTVAGSAFTAGGYSGAVRADSASVIKGQGAFVLDSAGHGAGTMLSSVANLGFFNPGDTIALEFVYAGDTNTRGPLVPNWEIDSLLVTEGNSGQATANFTVAATGTPPGNLFIQWQRDNGAGFTDIRGASGGFLAITPTLADNGARFRAVIYVPGATRMSATAVLTVVQPNTPPKFVKGADQTASEDGGPQAVPGWATGLQVHSIDRAPIVYGSTFDSLPPGATLVGGRTDGVASLGSGTVGNGVLRLTMAENGAWGVFTTPAIGLPIESFSVSFTEYVGGGTCCGATTADGFSVNIANDLPIPGAYGAPGEEGAGTGLSVLFDTWDNGGGEAPAIDLKWQGVVLQSVPIDPGQDGNAPRFIAVSITVDAGGVANVSFDGAPIFSNVALPGYAAMSNLRLDLGARTGGANDNHFIDDLLVQAFPTDSSSAENGQTLQFLVSNDNPGLFAAQPAISPDGTLTYTPAPDACGQATLSVALRDSGGTAHGGRDTSAAQTFVIAITPANDCPVANSGAASLYQGTSVDLLLTGSDPDSLTGCGPGISGYTISTPPAHGTLSGTPPLVTYTPDPAYSGPDSFSYTVTDGVCVSAPATASLQVLPNARPVAVAGLLSPACGIQPAGDPNLYAIALDDARACLVLNGGASTDADGDPLQYVWTIDGTNVLQGAVITNCFPVGCHTVELAVTDTKGAVGRSSLNVCAITACEAVEQCIALVNGANIGSKNKRPLLASLKSSCAAFERGDFTPALNNLHAFQNKVRAQITRENAAAAAAFTACAQKIIDAIDCAADLAQSGVGQ